MKKIRSNRGHGGKKNRLKNRPKSIRMGKSETAKIRSFRFLRNRSCAISFRVIIVLVGSFKKDSLSALLVILERWILL